MLTAHSFLMISAPTFDILCGKGRGEFEKFLSNKILNGMLSTGFLAIKDTPADYLNFFRKIYESKVTLERMHEYLVPKKIHQIWIGQKPLPEATKEYQKTFAKHHPDWEYRLWTDKDIENLELINKELYDKAPNPGEKSDILRLELLYKFGGVYLDTDCELVQPLDELHQKL